VLDAICSHCQQCTEVVALLIDAKNERRSRFEDAVEIDEFDVSELV
jgi:hypothetical protein